MATLVSHSHYALGWRFMIAGSLHPQHCWHFADVGSAASCAGTEKSKPPDVPDGRLEMELEDVCTQVDLFGAEEQWVSRLAISIHQLNVRDCSRPSATVQHGNRLLTHHASVRHPRDPAAPMFQVKSGSSIIITR